MTAYWGGQEVTLKRRLALLGELTSLATLNSGHDEAVGSVLEQLRAFHGADRCVQILEDAGAYRMHRVDGRGAAAEPVPDDLARAMLTLAPDSAVVFGSRGRWGARSRPKCFACDVTRGDRQSVGAAECEAIAARLDARCFLSVPVRSRQGSVGRIFLTSQRPIFAPADVAFLLQVVEHAAPVVENVRLADQLAADVAERERVRIARDLHDSVVQSYVGLELGLEAIHRRIASGDREVADDVERLTRLASESVVDLRRYMRELRHRFEPPGGLLTAVRRFVDAYSRETGIAVDVETEPDLELDDDLAAEAFQMIVEGLSNVRRHTAARSATVRIARDAGQLSLSLENEAESESPVPFAPRSIVERARALGGAAAVETDRAGKTIVAVAIPLGDTRRLARP
jgi:signal transduction histidine kinase